MKKNKAIEHPIVTIGIPVIPQREHYTQLCLDSICNQVFDRSFEILLAQHTGYHYEVPFSIPDNVIINQVESGESLSSKRNDILKHAKGKYILFVDDDIIADKNWLANMITSAEKNNSDIFWGTAKPIYEEQLPENIIPFEMYIGGFHYDSNGKLRRKGIIGCNFGIRKDLEHARGHFVEFLGRGSEIRGGEENLFLKEYVGDNISFVENAVVHHHIQSYKINFKYILYNQFNNTISQVFINNVLKISNRKFGADLIKEFIKSFIPRKNHLMNFILSFFMLMGYCKGIIKHSLYSNGFSK